MNSYKGIKLNIFKIDFKEFYDKVVYNFLQQQTLRMKGLDPTWCKYVQSFVQRGNIGIKVNY